MTRILVAGALMIVAAPVSAQAAVDLTYVSPVAGTWRYTPTATGSEATYLAGNGAPQVTIRCARATRAVTLLKAAPSPSPTLWVWTSVQARSLPATFDAATGRVVAQLPMLDTLLDAMASSRGRIGFATSGSAPLVVPAWGDVAHVVEDCRA